MKQPDLSIVIPVYNEEKNIQPLYAQLHNVLYTLPHMIEIIFVDDGSRDNTT
ncbi:glycosyltransferase, partial [Candidatus Woesearchaeota archaeon]|nr:glycosyltransferase [Candidatus Woesearchaeota archaeon]